MDILTTLLATAEATSETIPLETIGIIIMVAIALGIFAKKIGQNQVLGFIIAGFLLGPFWLNFLSPTDTLTYSFSTIGLFFLLFYLGLELSLKEFLEAGSSAIALAIVDMIVSVALGFTISIMLGYSLLFSIILGIMMFSTSTAIVAKFAIDRKIIQEKPVKTALSILILQDFLGIILLVFITSLGKQGNALSLGITALVFAVAVFTAVHKVSNIVQKWLEDNQYGQLEMTLYAIAVGAITAAVGGIIGLSTTLGAYFAGFALAETKTGKKIKEDLGFLRDFFLIFFFVAFGTTLFYNLEGKAMAIPEINQLIFLFGLAIALSIGALIAHLFSCTFFGHKCGMTTQESSTAAVLLLPLGEFVVIISTTAVLVLEGAEKILISPLAFLLIIITVVLFQPLYDRKAFFQKIIEAIPIKREIKPPAIQQALEVAEKDTKRQVQMLLLDFFVVLCLAWMTVILYKQIPDMQTHIPYGRLGVAIIAFCFFASVPFFNAIKAFRKLLSEKAKTN